MAVVTIMPLLMPFDTKSSQLKLTSEEEINLRDIKINFDYREMVIDLNNIDSEIYSLSEEKSELISLVAKLKESKESISENLRTSFENNEEEHISDKYYQEMKRSHNEIYKNKISIKDVNEKITAIENEKELLINSISDIKLKRKKELLKLKNKVRKRYINTLKEPITLSSKGSISCVSKNMDKCILDNEKNITNSILSKNNYTNISKNKEFIVNDAIMDYSGFLSYDISVKFLESYNKDTNLILNKIFETTDFKLILRSNFSDVKYIIDGIPVGSGSVISTTVTAGNHKIIATYKSLEEIANVHILKDSDFTFSFDKTNESNNSMDKILHNESKPELTTKDNIKKESPSLFKNPILKVAYSEGSNLFVIPTFPTLDKNKLIKYTVNNGKQVFGKLNYKQAYNICNKITEKSRMLNDDEYKLLFNIEKFNNNFNSKLAFWTKKNKLIHNNKDVKPYSNSIGNVVCYIPS
ncbi:MULTISPECIES: hypothetical protein [Aliivibrio]|uniref:PEGA domain-containing protein n=1 Tax=Aliivibrio finisterrensis TaxID=511998 RepID=A0A4Q5KVM0_9GAMM|nr:MULTISPECIES: hypothetical protein [Aliivibrio]MDD9179374.1 hypothetical protein [Aliivibrio sp. A6]RYU51363.1 hypothetical protein ERW57_09570 [Aliivibrio finisterrensis]RYU52543.1 hypothetical protein ERW56_09910 [Aliivibrio finisterrensis]RYU58073.1 hypothetical protein ERW50_09335 [Aliivibrio finisterrensis]RYU64561.1 hypothetical protein ERW53_09090 [Aliivibrio finisterrensis]